MSDPYQRFKRIDGRHPFRRAVPDGYVDYPARRLRGARVVYFNFALAREMGLIPRSHASRLTPKLERAITDAFSLVIVNEFDEQHGLKVPARDRLPHRYMATRYLQLQHPGRTGRTSGDGRSIWNGTVRANGATWDVTSCGTGVTRLSPATALQKRFFRTGTRITSYGCGTATIAEGLNAALMSETFHRNHIETERMLAVLILPSGGAINVRAGRNLVRPSHFFAPLKQGNLPTLRGLADYYIDRQIANGAWPALRGKARRYRYMADAIARAFARAAATFESEYIFCWLDWDGDNVLADGAIIDYGSVRQFGLYHREYRFDDVERFSTTLPEQRRKARAIVQNFAQTRDYLVRGEKRPLHSFRSDRTLRIFDREFEAERRRLLVRKIGLETGFQDTLLSRHAKAVDRFRRAVAYFEHAKSSKGPCKVPDGLSWNAIFSVRDLLRELPARYREDPKPLPASEFLAIASTPYASQRDRAVTPHRARMAAEFQRAYLDLVQRVSRSAHVSADAVIESMVGRAAILNRRDRITGDSVEHATRRLVSFRKRLGPQLSGVVERFVASQDLEPEPSPRGHTGAAGSDAKRVLDGLLSLVEELRYGL